jgi:serine/threonine-protein kinase
VKPQNVLLTPDGDAKVTDFGIARSLDVEHGMTQTGTVLGTSNYLSPEQASGKATTPSTDVYSLGVVLYELLTAEVPFPGDNFVAVAMKHINEPVPDLLQKRPDVPLRLAAAVDRAMAKDPESRFPTMNEFASELRQCLVELDTPDAERTVIKQSPVLKESRPHRVRASRSRAPLYALLALVAIAAIVAGILALGGSKDTPKGAPPSPTGARVALSGVSADDPFGNNRVEHNSEAPNATDGNAATYWQTEHYNDGLGKPGVGVVLSAPRDVALKQMTVTTDTPGFTAQIRVGSSPTGPFTQDSSPKISNDSSVFALKGTSGKYYEVWITNLGSNSSVHVNEVTARS